MRHVARWSSVLLIVAALFSLTFGTILFAEAGPVDLDAVAATARKSEERLRTSGGAWTVINTLPSGAVIRVSVLRSGDKQRTIVRVEHDGQGGEVLRVISRDGVWYVSDPTGFYKYRPYEVPVGTPFIYMALERSEPMFFEVKHSLGAADLKGAEGDFLTFHTPLDPVTSNQLQGGIDQMESMSKESGKKLTPELQKQMEDSKELIAHGVSARVNVSTGEVVEFGGPRFRTQVVEFRFIDAADQSNFAVNDHEWKDYSDDPTAGNLDDLIMLGHQPGMHVGDKNYELDGRLMDIKTGRFRRIPYAGSEVVPSCFTKDRLSAVVSGMDGETGMLRPFVIDLKTQKCRALGSPLLDNGYTFFGDISPDGRTLVVTHMDLAAHAGLLNSQICLINLESGKSVPVGKPMDTAGVHWTADGRHLVLLSRSYTDMNATATGSLAIMDMRGEVKVLREGDSPVVLADRQTILFEDAGTRLWHTCDLEGQNDQVYAGGMKGFGFPAPSPDGKRILMMHFIPNQLPVPMVFPIGESNGKAVTDVGGLWGEPAWR